MSRDTIAQGMEARLGDFAGLNARVNFDLGADGVISVDATQSPPRLASAEQADGIGEADCTIRVSAADLEGLMTGALNPMLAYTLGKLKVEGSMGTAMKVAALLEE